MDHFGARIEHNGKVSFRVWAPLAKQVDIVGDFNNWDGNQNPMINTGNGFWEGSANNLHSGDKYKFLIHRRDGEVKQKMDPASRDTIDSDVNNALNHSIIVSTRHTWTPFSTPAFDNLIIYQLHIGSFCGRNDDLHRANWTATFTDAISKLDYIREMGFNAVEFLPIQEFRDERSWGYNPSFFYALESAYGRPPDLRRLVDECHHRGLAVIFDVVYNHISNVDSSFWHFDDADANSYLSEFETPWGLAPACRQDGIKQFFFANMVMYFKEYKADGIRFDATRYMEYNKGLGNDGWEFMQYLTWQAKQFFPDKYLVAEHLPSHDSIVNSAGFHATWFKPSYESVMDALQGNDPVANIRNALGLNFGNDNNYSNSWNLVKYLLGSHDECGDMEEGKKNHRYFIEFFGGRNNWYARAKARMAWCLNISMMGTPMMFMGNECHMWGYWHDSGDINGDHRFDWSIAGDPMGFQMRRLVGRANAIRWRHSSLRNGFMEITHEDRINQVIGYKRWNNDGDIVLIAVNAGDITFATRDYGVASGQPGRWIQELCSQDSDFGGWDGAGNAFYEPVANADGKIYINLPKWSVSIFKWISP